MKRGRNYKKERKNGKVRESKGRKKGGKDREEREIEGAKLMDRE